MNRRWLEYGLVAASALAYGAAIGFIVWLVVRSGAVGP